MKRILLAMLLLALAMPVLAADSTYAPGTCYFVQGNTGLVCQSGASITMESGSTLTMNGTPTFGTAPKIASGGTAPTGVADSTVLSGVRQTTLTFTLTGANDIDVEDGGKTKGTLIWTAPEGVILVYSAVINASVVTNNVYNTSTNDVYYVGVGTADGTKAADADLTGTEQNIIAKTTLDTVSSTTLTLPWTGYMGTLAYANNVFDGHTTPVKLYMNVAVPDASNTGATTHAVTGTLTIVYSVVGDY